MSHRQELGGGKVSSGVYTIDSQTSNWPNHVVIPVPGSCRSIDDSTVSRRGISGEDMSVGLGRLMSLCPGRISLECLRKADVTFSHTRRDDSLAIY